MLTGTFRISKRGSKCTRGTTLRKVTDAEIMHVVDAKRIELDAYQLKSMAKTWFDQWKDSRVEYASHPSWSCFKETFFGRFFPHESKEANMREFLTMK